MNAEEYYHKKHHLRVVRRALRDLTDPFDMPEEMRCTCEMQKKPKQAK
jgi:hypothetical protein